jgi:hypothetical protein
MAPLPFLDWPPDLFAEAHAVRFTAPGVSLKQRSNENICACGCNQRHNRAVSRLEDKGGDRRVVWFRTIGCKNKYLGIGPGMT